METQVGTVAMSSPVKEVEEKWLDYIKRMMRAKMEPMIDEILKGKRDRRTTT